MVAEPKYDHSNNRNTGDQTLSGRADDRRNSDESLAERYRVPLSNTIDSVADMQKSVIESWRRLKVIFQRS